MLKAVLGVIVGYIAMAAIVMLCFAGAWFILGEDGSFKPGSWEASTTWLGMSFAVAFVGAVIGGLICAAIAGKGSKAPAVLAGLVLILGIIMSIPAMTKELDTTPRTSPITMRDATTKAHQPMISSILNPVVGAVGVLLGGCFRKR